MEYIVLMVIILTIISFGILILKKTKVNANMANNDMDNNNLQSSIDKKLPCKNKQINKLNIKIDPIPIETFHDESKLIEITDDKILERVNNLLPELFQVGRDVKNATQAFKGDVLYRAVIPSGAKLADSKAMNGAVRGFYQRNDGRIQGHANFFAVKTSKSTVIANTLVAAMDVASLVVGQYYMTQINNELNEISDGITKITNFLNAEYRGRFISLFTHVKKIAEFQIEILENDELRITKLAQLDSLEEECTKLLGQANFMLNELSQKNNFDYKTYEKVLKEIQDWYSYQNILLSILFEIADLRYTLHRGAMSREQCVSVLNSYIEMVCDTQTMLTEWHNTNMQRLGIDLQENRRKRTGIDGFLHALPSKINEKYKYKDIETETVELISNQTLGYTHSNFAYTSELYTKDVQLISKDGKIYYLPEI